jgi:hypothetical protein
VLVGGAVGWWWFALRPKPLPRVAMTGVPAQLASEPLVGPPPGDEVRILAGSTRSYVDHADKMWSADAWFAGGTAVKNEARHIGRTQDESFYRTSREGQFRYDIPLKAGGYELHLHFAETEYGPENTGVGGEGSRLMTVRANGVPLLSHFDVTADAGGERMADDRVFPGLRPAKDGRLHLEFAGENGANATLSAIEILPGLGVGPDVRMRPVRLLARQTPYYSNDSHWWGPDDYFDGGQLATYSEPVSGTTIPSCMRRSGGEISRMPFPRRRGGTRWCCILRRGTGVGISRWRRKRARRRGWSTSLMCSRMGRRFWRISIWRRKRAGPMWW